MCVYAHTYHGVLSLTDVGSPALRGGVGIGVDVGVGGGVRCSGGGLRGQGGGCPRGVGLGVGMGWHQGVGEEVRGEAVRHGGEVGVRCWCGGVLALSAGVPP